MNFRYDINGLRAIAVIAVVLFHFNPSWVPGGFAGVDVFFVISGFLMTSIIFRGLENDNFNLFKFYVARANRIIPALTVLCLALLAFGYLFLPPIDYYALGKHALSSLGFFSNIIYWKESGYFDAASYEKWLLHTWSLSVEWQFYIIYPVVLMALKKLLSIENIKRFLVLGTLLGFAFSVVATIKWPNPAYYLLPTRAWEMMFGGLAFLYPISMGDQQKKLAEYLGLALIVISYAFISSNLAWPGYWALVPVLGAYLIIVADRQDSIVTNNLIFQELGKWSYSIYLWHWPIVAFVNRFKLDDKYHLGIATSVLLGFVSCKFIERKMYISSALSLREMSKIFACTLMITIVFGAYIFESNGIENRVRNEFNLTKEEYHSKYYGGAGYASNKVIYFNTQISGNYDLAITGDSYALQYASAIDQSGIPTIALFDHGCLIFPNYSRWLNGQEDISCSDEFLKLKAALVSDQTPLLIAHSWDSYTKILTQKGAGYVLKLNKAEYFKILEEELSNIFGILGKRSYYLLGVPQRAKVKAFDCLASTELIGYRLLMGDCETSQEKLDNWDINILLKEIASRFGNVHYIEPNDALCNSKICNVIIDREPVHSDGSHLSVVGASLVAEHFLSIIN
ncbi:acyltransferase family protein [Vibrio breoganii]